MSLSEKNETRLNKNTALVFRISGIIFFIISMISVVEMFSTNITTYLYILDEHSTRGWSIFFFISALIYTSSFLFSLFATGTTAIFGGKNGYTQSVWNCTVYSAVLLSIYTTMQLVTGLDSEMQFFLVTSIIMTVIFGVIVFVCLHELPEFSKMWKNVFPKDENSKLCMRVYLIMLVLIEVGSFLYSHKLIQQ